jgi:hypothetical protein
VRELSEKFDRYAPESFRLSTENAGLNTGGLWVGKFLKTHSYQKILTDKAASPLRLIAKPPASAVFRQIEQ